MYKLLIYPFLLLILLYAYIDQLSNELAFNHYYKMKYAINRATHAAALQIDEEALSQGDVRINEELAFTAANQLLHHNVQHEQYNILFFKIINDVENGPFHYVNHQWNIDVILHKPAVIIVVNTSINHIISTKPIYKWEISGTSEVVTSFK